MGVVVDDASNATAQAAQIAPGTSDLQALSAAGDTATQNNSGLVCAINNVPADGLQNCLKTAGGGQYYYWSYWEGDPYTNTWTYANVGPASHTVDTGQTYVEGWRYQDPGADNPTATKPAVTPSDCVRTGLPRRHTGASRELRRFRWWRQRGWLGWRRDHRFGRRVFFRGGRLFRLGDDHYARRHERRRQCPHCCRWNRELGERHDHDVAPGCRRRHTARRRARDVDHDDRRRQTCAARWRYDSPGRSPPARRNGRRRPGPSHRGGGRRDRAARWPGMVALASTPRRRMTRRPSRSLHPLAWWLWAVCLAVVAMQSLNPNPFLLLLICGVACFVVSSCRGNEPWSRSLAFFLRLGVVIIVIRVAIEILFGQRGLPGHFLFTLPRLPLPSWAAGVSIGGAVSLESILTAFVAGLQIAVGRGLLRRRELSGQPLPVAALPARRPLRSGGGGHGRARRSPRN